MSKFIITLDSGNAVKRNAITVYFQARSWAVWHHFEDMWLLNNVPDNVKSQEIYIALSQLPIIGESSIFVMRIESTSPITYFGRGPKAGWEWLAAQNWGQIA